MFGGIATHGKILVFGSARAKGEIHVLDLRAGKFVRSIPYAGDQGQAADVAGIALSEDGSIYVADPSGGRIRRFTAFGVETEGIEGPRSVSIPRDRRGIPAIPRGLVFDRMQRLWVSCGDRPWVHGLQVYDRDGRYLASAKSFGEQGKSFGPASGLTERAGQILVADSGNDCIQRFSADLHFIGRYALGKCAYPIDVAPFRGGLAVLVQEPEPRVGLFDSEFEWAGLAPGAAFRDLGFPCALCSDASGTLYVLYEHGERVRCIHEDLEVIGEFEAPRTDVERREPEA